MIAPPDFPPPPERLEPRRALISLSDKTGLEEAARSLHALGLELVSTGGTAAVIAAAGLPVRDVADLTGFPEMLDGRVKTLHPRVHGGLLGVRNDPGHARAMDEHGIVPIDLVWIDLYPFERTAAAGAAFEACVENIDIGGPAMIRSAAKNHGHVAVCVDRDGLSQVLTELETEGYLSLDLRRRLAADAFARTAAYDSAVASWFAGAVDVRWPRRSTYAGELIQTMRYGENPHQQAAFYRSGRSRFGVTTARQLQGKELSYNNVADIDAAFELVAEFDPARSAACVIVKHANPCGVALGASPREAYERALACDPVSAFGGIVAFNRPLDGDAAAKATEIFTEAVIAPTITREACEAFAAKRNLRLLEAGGLPDPADQFDTVRSVAGGFLIQSRDGLRIERSRLQVVTQRAPSEAEIDDLLFAFAVARHVKSNAIVYARAGQTAGVGAGQMNRRDSARIAALRAEEAGLALGLGQSLARGGVCASDAFFPFADGLIEAAAAGVTAVIQPGGAMRDEEVIAAADAHGLAMVFTGVRTFRH